MDDQAGVQTYSDPQETLFAAMLVPNWAKAKAKLIKKTPARVPEPPSSRNAVRSSSGLQMASPKMTLEEDETMIPMKEVIAKPIGIVESWDQSASVGRRANLAKSQSLTIRVAKLLMEDMMPETTAQPNADLLGRQWSFCIRISNDLPVYRVGLVNNRADTMCSYNSPNEKGNSSHWNNIRLHREEMSDLMDWKPDGR
jgi:hypothetical protein